MSADRGSVAIGGSAINSPTTIYNGLDEQGVGRVLDEKLAALALERGVPEAPLRAVLVKLGEAEVPALEIPARLASAADELVKLRAELERARNDRPEFAAIRARALALIDKGEFEAARKALQGGRAAAKEMREEMSHTEAAFLLDEARIDRLQLRYDEACDKLDEATRLDPRNVLAWGDLGDLWVLRGSLSKAETACAGALKACIQSGDDREVSVAQNKIGDVRVAQGNLPEALRAFEAGRVIVERLAQSDPRNAEWQRDLSVSEERIGDVRVAQSNLAEALRAFEAGRVIRERLARSDPANAQWQRDLSVSEERIGDVRVALGNLAEALRAFEACHVIRERLAESDPGNAQWQRDLSVSENKIGDVRMAQGKLPEALRAFEAGRVIAERLAESDPGNAQWQRDLSVSENKIGGVRKAQGNLSEALSAFEAARVIRERLAQADPGNAEWQRDLIVSCVKIAEADPRRARSTLRQALDIAQGLQADGRLVPRDTWMVENLARRLAALPD